MTTNRTSLSLVFLGRFRIRPVSQLAAPFELASWTGQQGDRLRWWEHIYYTKRGLL